MNQEMERARLVMRREMLNVAIAKCRLRLAIRELERQMRLNRPKRCFDPSLPALLRRQAE